MRFRFKANANESIVIRLERNSKHFERFLCMCVRVTQKELKNDNLHNQEGIH